MKRLVLWFGLAFLAIAGALLVQMPASMVQRVLASQVPPLTLQQVTGTLWQGRAGRATWYGYPLGQLEWRLSALSLTLLKPRITLSLTGVAINGRTDLIRQLDGALVATNGHLTLPATWLQQIINQPLLGLRGDVEISIERGQLDPQGWLVALEGSAKWRNAGVSSAANSAQLTALGDLQMSWQTEVGGQIFGTLSDSGGALDLSGEVSIANRAYRVRALLAPRSGDPRLREALSYLGRSDGQGRVRLEIFGPLIALKGK